MSESEFNKDVVCLLYIYIYLFFFSFFFFGGAIQHTKVNRVILVHKHVRQGVSPH